MVQNRASLHSTGPYTRSCCYRWGEAIEDFKYKKRQYLYLSDRVGVSGDTVNLFLHMFRCTCSGQNTNIALLFTLQVDPDGADPNKLSVWTVDITKVSIQPGVEITCTGTGAKGVFCGCVANCSCLHSHALLQRSP